MNSGRDFPKISITGDLGSGKSMVSKMLSAETGYEIYSTGRIQRQIAADYNMTTLELNEYSENHPEIDERIDGFSKELRSRDESMIVDSRLAWFFIPESFKIYLHVDPVEAARRILGDRDRQSEAYADQDEAKRDILARKASENKRFLTLYGADCAEMSNFDLVVDTSHITPEEVFAQIMAGYRAWLKQ